MNCYNLCIAILVDLLLQVRLNTACFFLLPCFCSASRWRHRETRSLSCECASQMNHLQHNRRVSCYNSLSFLSSLSPELVVSNVRFVTVFVTVGERPEMFRRDSYKENNLNACFICDLYQPCTLTSVSRSDSQLRSSASRRTYLQYVQTLSRQN